MNNLTQIWSGREDFDQAAAQASVWDERRIHALGAQPSAHAQECMGVASVSDKISDIIARVLDEHRPVHDPHGHVNGTVPGRVSVYDCWCERVVQTTLSECLAHQSEALLAALKAQRIAVVELPGRCVIPASWRGDNCLGAWQGPAGEDPVSAWRTNRYDHDAVAMPGGDFIPAPDARALGLALLAAADAAEGGAAQ